MMRESMRKQRVFARVMAVVISVGAFLAARGATALTEAQAAEKTAGDWSYEVLDDGTAAIMGYDGDATDLEIPESIDGVTVTSIGDWAFNGYSSLTSVSIPESVSNIGGRAFDGTKWLENRRAENPLVVVNGVLIDGETA